MRPRHTSLLTRLLPAALLLVAPAITSPTTAVGALQREERAALSLRATRTAEAPGTTATFEAVVTVEAGWHVNSHQPTFEYLIATELTVEAPQGWPAPTVHYPQGVLRTFAFEKQPLSVYEGATAIPIELQIPANTPDGPRDVAVKLRYQACSDRICLPPVDTSATLALRVGTGGEALAATNTGEALAATNTGEALAATGTGKAVPPARGVAGMLLLAVLGGLILNLMPCVLPVLSLKVFGLVRSAGAGRQRITGGALATAAGILISFLALATAAVLARAAGSAVGWGIQFQNAGFVAFLAAVVMLFCLNLWGLFEIPLPARLARFADQHQGDEGPAGHFASGLFATLMATPCSAPFLGSAVGFALGQTTPIIFAIFLAVGLGMALPYLTLALFPGAARILPRPGAWMDTFKGLMGFLLAAAAIWLFYVLAAQLSTVRLALVQLMLLAMALFAWLLHRSPPDAIGRRVYGLLLLICAIAAPLVAIGGQASGDSAAGAAHRTLASRDTLHLIHWQPWDEREEERLVGEGKSVFVDVTADWCFTCKVNERLVLETPEMADAFERGSVVALRADWTNRNDTISAYLAKHGRYGIPFYLAHVPGREPRVLPELLTKDAVLEALRR